MVRWSYLDPCTITKGAIIFIKINSLYSSAKKPPKPGGFDVEAAKLLNLNGGQRRDRTADAGLFRAALYH